MHSWWCKHLPNLGPGPVGLMADSHGDSDAIGRALACLKGHGCGRIVHLGDICDSSRPTTAAACMAALTACKVLAVCGNNDRALMTAGAGLDGTDAGTMAWLARLPMIIDTPSALFTHSRPDVAQLGAAALIGDLDDAAALRFLLDFPGRLLFRGHGHAASIRCRSGKRLIRITPPLAGGPDCPVAGGAVITCGCLADGSVWVWNPAASTVRRLRL